MKSPLNFADSLVDFYNRIRGRAGTDIARADRRTLKQVADVRDFDTFVETLFGLMPDPDEVLKKAGMTATVYRDTLTDAHVAGSLMQRKSRVKRMEIQVLAGDAEDPRSVQVRDLVEDQVSKISRMENVINEILDAPFFGATYLELFWNRETITTEKPNGEIVLENIVGKPFEWFVWDLDGNLKIRTDMLSMTPTSAKDIPPFKIFPVVKDGTYLNPYGDRAVKRVYWPYNFKKGGLRFWTEFLEKYGMPFIFGKPDPSKNQDEVNEFFNALVDMVRNGVVVSQTGSQKDEINVIETSNKSGSTDAYKSYKNAMNIEISKAILGETLTIENSESGSQAATETHLEVLESLQDEDKSMVESALSGIFKMISRLNVGPDTAPPVAQLVDPKELSLKQAERDGILVEKIGVRFKKTYISTTYKINEDDFEVGPLPAKGGQGEPGDRGVGGDQGGGAPAAGGKPALSTKKTEESVQAPEKEGEETPESSFSEVGESFAVRSALDSYIEDALSRYDKLTAPLKVQIAEIVKTSQDFGEFTFRMATLRNQVDQGLFADVFRDALAIAELAGEWSVVHNKT